MPKFLAIHRASDENGSPLQEVPLYTRLAALALRRPWIVPQLLSTAWAMRALRWYSRAPYLPLPPRTYVDWRMETAYGHGGRAPTAEELVRYVAWSSRMRRLMRRAVDD